MKSITRVTGGKKSHPQLSHCAADDSRIRVIMVFIDRILGDPRPDPPTTGTSTNLIVIIFINRKHRSVCGN